MNYYIYYVFIVFLVASKSHSMIAMQSQGSASLAMQKFVGHELTVLTMVDSSLEQRKSLNFLKDGKIIAIFNYKNEQVIAYFDEESHCKFPYILFKEIMKKQLENRELQPLQKVVLEQKNSEEKKVSEIEKAYADTCVCCIS